MVSNLVLYLIPVIAFPVAIIYIAMIYFVFIKIFGRGDDPYLDEVDLSKTGYAPYKDKVVSTLKLMRDIETETVECESFDGLKLKGEYYHNGGKKLAIMFHGYRSRALNNFAVSGHNLMEHGYDLLLINERALGKSEGKYTTFGVLEWRDVLKWVDWAKSNTRVPNVILYGVSMGGYSVARTADVLDKNYVKAIIVDSAYISPYKAIEFFLNKRWCHYPLVLPLFNWFSKMIFKDSLKELTKDHLQNTQIPMMFIHGKRDEHVPYLAALTNYEYCASKKEIVLVDIAAHTGSFAADEETVSKKLYDFINQIEKENEV